MICFRNLGKPCRKTQLYFVAAVSLGVLSCALGQAQWTSGSTIPKEMKNFAHQLNGGETNSATRLGECGGVSGDALEIQG